MTSGELFFGQKKQNAETTFQKTNYRNIFHAEAMFRNSFSINDLETLKNTHPQVYLSLVNLQLAKKVSYVNTKGEKIELEGVEIINREAMCFLIKSKYTKVEDGFLVHNKQPFELLFLDGKDFASYNIQDTEGNYGGDVVLNLMAKQLILATKKIAKILSLKENQLVPARLGGDEFVVLINSELTETLAQLCNSLIKTEISEIKAEYYNSDGEIGERRVEIKNNRVERIKPPNDEFLNKLFFYYISKNTIYDSFGLNKVASDLHQDRSIQGLKFQPPEIKYPVTVKTVAEKVTYLAQINPNFSDICNQAIILDMNPGSLNSNRYGRSVLRFYENIVLNPLYGHEVMNFYSFIEKLAISDYRIIVVVDPKFLKEINNQMSEGRGDMYLKKTFDKVVYDSVRHIPADNKIFGEIRGKLLIAIKHIPSSTNESDIDDANYYQIIQKLEQATKEGVEFNIGGKDLSLFFGYSINYFQNAKQNSTKSKSNRDLSMFLETEIEYINYMESVFDRWLQTADSSAYNRVIDDIITNKISLSELKLSLYSKAYLSSTRVDIMSGNASIEDMLDIHFTSPVNFKKYIEDGLPIPKRFFLRVQKLIELCSIYPDNGKGEIKKKKKELIEFFENCIQHMKNATKFHDEISS